MVFLLYFFLLTISLISCQDTSERPPYGSEIEEKEVFDVTIIGCGPSGLQAALVAIQMNLSYVVLEKSGECGDFFRHYPRRGDLISLNKPNVPESLEGWDDDNARDYALRFDWHSMLHANLTFPPYTTKFYPHAEVFVNYLNDVVSQNSIKVRYHQEVQEISQRFSFATSAGTGSPMVREHFLVDGSTVRSRTTLIASGLKLASVDSKELRVYNHLYPNARFYTYENAPVDDCKVYFGKHVIIVGNGNAANELSSFIINECAPMRTWVLGKNSMKASHMTHYVGNVRTHNMAVMESYQLKSLDAIFNVPPYGDATDAEIDDDIERGNRCAAGLERADDDCSDPMVPSESENIILIFSGGFRSSDTIRLLTDDRVDVFAKENLYKNRYPALAAFNEVKGCEGVFATGAISHGRDYKESSGGFVHGFRYTTVATMKYLEVGLDKTKKWPYKVFNSTVDVEAHIKRRMQSSSALWHLQGFYCDLLFHVPDSYSDCGTVRGSTFLYVEQIPVTWEMDIVSRWVLADFASFRQSSNDIRNFLVPDDSQETKTNENSRRDSIHVTTLEHVIVDFLLGEEAEEDGKLGSTIWSCYSPPHEEDVDEDEPDFDGDNIDSQSSSRANGEIKLELSMLQSCKPEFFDDYEIFVDGNLNFGGFESLSVKLYHHQVVRIVNLMKDTSTIIQVNLVGSSRLGAGRVALLFEYGVDFKGCEAVYSDNNAGTGFIAPTVYLEQDPRSTPYAWRRNSKGSENLKQWKGWDKITEKEDLFARWREFDRVDAVLDTYFEVAGMEDRELGSSYKFSDKNGRREVFEVKLARKSRDFADLFHHGSTPPWQNIFDLDLTQVGVY